MSFIDRADRPGPSRPSGNEGDLVKAIYFLKELVNATDKALQSQ